MFDGIRQNWRVFIRSEPGRRFEERYRYSQQSKRGPAKRVVWLSAGIVLVVLGLFFLVAPGPGIFVPATRRRSGFAGMAQPGTRA